jgi:Holliday junction DNA helicase RuvA
VGVLRAAPGVGTKMAERILVELRDRVDELAALVSPVDAGTEAPDGEATVREQTLSALVNLGYPKAQAERVLADAEDETGRGASIETLVRVSLRRLAK